VGGEEGGQRTQERGTFEETRAGRLKVKKNKKKEKKKKKKKVAGDRRRDKPLRSLARDKRGGDRESGKTYWHQGACDKKRMRKMGAQTPTVFGENRGRHQF